MKKMGFLLIEALIYLFLSSIFLLLIFQFTANVYTKYQQIVFSNSTNSCLYSALDLVSRDIQQSSNDPKAFKMLKPNNLIFTVKNENAEIDIGWHLIDGNLYRKEGRYDQNAWKNEIKSLVCQNVNSFNAEINKSNYLSNSQHWKMIRLVTIAIETNIENKKSLIKRSIFPRAGLVVL